MFCFKIICLLLFSVGAVRACSHSVVVATRIAACQRFERNLSNAPILKLVKSCTFHHGLVCFLCKRYVLILGKSKFWCSWKRKFSFTDFLVCSNGFNYTCFAGVNAEGGNLYFIIIIIVFTT